MRRPRPPPGALRGPPGESSSAAEVELRVARLEDRVRLLEVAHNDHELRIGEAEKKRGRGRGKA